MNTEEQKKKKYDASIHFTIKGQTMEEIDKKIDIWLENQSLIDFSEKAEGEPSSVLHHCFLPRETVVAKGFGTEVVDVLDEISGENQIRWFGASDTLGMSRLLMLQNIKRLNGIALFVGEVKEGVKEEYELATQIGVECILIP